jgi:hypothetical protein
MLPWWMPWVGGGVAVVAIFWAGDNYGYNARQYAACKAETARRNDAISKVNTDETKRHAGEEAKRSTDRAAFDKASIGQCLLTGDQAAALNGIGE